MQVRFPARARDFPPRVNFQCRLFHGVRTPPCAIACINICVHIKDPVVYVRFRWIMETLKHLACTVGWLARLCRSWLSPGNATRFSHWIKKLEQYSRKKFFFKYLNVFLRILNDRYTVETFTSFQTKHLVLIQNGYPTRQWLPEFILTHFYTTYIGTVRYSLF